MPTVPHVSESRLSPVSIMRRLLSFGLISSVFFGSALQVRPATSEFLEATAALHLRWPTQQITVALSTSLESPGANFKPGSDVLSAARRALARWQGVADIQIVEVSSNAQSISAAGGRDGINLITIANTRENNLLFAGNATTGRTRVFYDEKTGAISEADIVINPHPVASNGLPVQFSTDGTPGTYDLESTFTHEIGHLLGLDHSPVISSTMQPRQALNGTYKLPAFIERTISESDRTALRALYGPNEGTGTIAGVIRGLSGQPKFGYVWAEELSTGRVMASQPVLGSGRFRLDGLLPGNYRIFSEAADVSLDGSRFTGEAALFRARSMPAFEIASQVLVKPNEPVDIRSASPSNGTRFFSPNLIGTNGELSSTAVPVAAGTSVTVLIGGQGIEQIAAAGVSSSSRFLTIEAASLSLKKFNDSLPVLSLTITTAPAAPAGDYSLRLESNAREVAYLPGAITVDPGVESTFSNADDDPQFFVSHHYRDFLGREPDPDGLSYWVNELLRCGKDEACIRQRRNEISLAFQSETESQNTGRLLHGLYRLAYGREPKFEEFLSDRDRFESEQALALAFVQRAAFRIAYPENLTGEEFLDRLLRQISPQSAAAILTQRDSLLGLYDKTEAGRAVIILRIAENPVFTQIEFNRALVMMQYFGYLRRDPNEDEFKFWLKHLEQKPAGAGNNRPAMVCAFLTSEDYQRRFGIALTHSPSDCAK